MQEESNQPHEQSVMTMYVLKSPGPTSLVLNLWVATFAGVEV